MPAFRFLPLEFCRLRKYKLLIIPPSSFRPACFVAHRHIAHLPIMINCSFGRLPGPHTETTGWPAHRPARRIASRRGLHLQAQVLARVSSGNGKHSVNGISPRTNPRSSPAALFAIGRHAQRPDLPRKIHRRQTLAKLAVKTLAVGSGHSRALDPKLPPASLHPPA